LSLSKKSQEKELVLFINVELNMNKELSEIEVEFIHVFEMM